MPQYINEEGHALVKAWIDGVELEDAARAQVMNVATLPFIYKHIAVMPDAHWGMGATIGTVIASKTAIVPAAVGVDLGCGMIAQKLMLDASHLPDSLKGVRTAIERTIPHGRTDNGAIALDKGAHRHDAVPEACRTTFGSGLQAQLKRILEAHPKLGTRGSDPLHQAYQQFGTLGTGNHFIELCLDEEDQVWVMLHSGSRGIGNRLASHFIARAKKNMEIYGIELADKDLAYFPDQVADFLEYIAVVGWAQDYALMSREVMLFLAIQAIQGVLGRQLVPATRAVNCHHNYVVREHHFGENVWVTRKGAVRAQLGDYGIIPGSMGAKSYIVKGKGNPDSFHSCSHGAGRRMGRKEAKRRFTVEDHVEATKGVECRKDEGVLDETPGAYKSIDSVMAAQRDLVDIVHTLRQVVNVKG